MGGRTVLWHGDSLSWKRRAVAAGPADRAWRRAAEGAHLQAGLGTGRVGRPRRPGGGGGAPGLGAAERLRGVSAGRGGGGGRRAAGGAEVGQNPLHDLGHALAAESARGLKVPQALPAREASASAVEAAAHGDARLRRRASEGFEAFS